MGKYTEFLEYEGKEIYPEDDNLQRFRQSKQYMISMIERGSYHGKEILVRL